MWRESVVITMNQPVNDNDENAANKVIELYDDDEDEDVLHALFAEITNTIYINVYRIVSH